jgi:hypothetical protein
MHLLGFLLQKINQTSLIGNWRYRSGFFFFALQLHAEKTKSVVTEI